MSLIENLLKNEQLIAEYKKQELISESLSRADIEIIKRLIVSGIEGILLNLFVRRNIATTGITWRM